MKSEMECSIVEDLLPSFVEELTREETNEFMEEHLKDCASCRKKAESLSYEMEHVEKAPERELKFLKKVKKTKLLGAVLSALFALFIAFGIYSYEFRYTLDHGDLSRAVTEYVSPFEKEFEGYALETLRLEDGALLVSFKDFKKETRNGVAEFEKGVNGKYRIIRASLRTSAYSSVIQTFYWEEKEEKKVVVSGYSLSKDIARYGLEFSAYKSPGFASDERVERTLTFPVKNLQFLEVYSLEALVEELKKSENQELYNYHLTDVSFYDETGEDITESFLVGESGNQGGSGIGSAELWLVYVLMFLVLGFGAIMVRYFLTD